MSEKIVEIKVFSQEIFLFVNELIQQLVPNHLEFSEESFRKILDSHCVHLFVMYDANETPVCMLSVGIYRTPSGCKAWIEDVVVDQIYRGRGYGEKIVLYAINFLRDTEADSISLTTNSSRVVANSLYKKLGFELYETNLYRMKL